MRKELCAVLTLCLLLIGSVANEVHLVNLQNQLSDHLSYSIRYCLLDDYSAAAAETNKAQQIWKDAESYTHIFLRHSELDALSDLFHDVFSAIQNREKYEAVNLLNKMQDHANTLIRMEKITLGSVF